MARSQTRQQAPPEWRIEMCLPGENGSLCGSFGAVHVPRSSDDALAPHCDSPLAARGVSVREERWKSFLLRLSRGNAWL